MVAEENYTLSLDVCGEESSVGLVPQCTVVISLLSPATSSAARLLTWALQNTAARGAWDDHRPVLECAAIGGHHPQMPVKSVCWAHRLGR